MGCHCLLRRHNICHINFTLYFLADDNQQEKHVFDSNTYYKLGSPGGSDSKQSARNAGDPGSIPGSEDPLEKEVAARSSALAWRIHRQRSLMGSCSGGHRELDTTE